MLERIILALYLLLMVILAIYNYLQAIALRGMERAVRELVAMQIQDRRSKAAKELECLNPLVWFSIQASAGFEKSICVVEVLRVIPGVQAVDLRTLDSHRLVVSILPKSRLLRFDRRLQARSGVSASKRVSGYISQPLLGDLRWGWRVKVKERALSQISEFFDLEATIVGKKVGVNWDQPSRLWFYVVD